MNEGRFFEQSILVTGAAGGIGRATCKRFVQEGGLVIATDLKERALPELTADLRDVRKGVVFYPLDVSNAAEVESFVNKVMKDYGRIDVLVNNAGIFSKTPILDLQLEDWDRLMAINLRGTLICSQAVLRGMSHSNHGGSIVNIGSLAGEVGGVVAGADYAASKAGIIALTKSLAKQAAFFGVRVNVVNPGVIDTAMIKQFPKESLDAMIALTPLKRVGCPEEVASAVAFLASEDASFITGTSIDVNGGLHM